MSEEQTCLTPAQEIARFFHFCEGVSKATVSDESKWRTVQRELEKLGTVAKCDACIFCGYVINHDPRTWHRKDTMSFQLLGKTICGTCGDVLRFRLNEK